MWCHWTWNWEEMHIDASANQLQQTTGSLGHLQCPTLGHQWHKPSFQRPRDWGPERESVLPKTGLVTWLELSWSSFSCTESGCLTGNVTSSIKGRKEEGREGMFIARHMVIHVGFITTFIVWDAGFLSTCSRSEAHIWKGYCSLHRTMFHVNTDSAQSQLMAVT